jgi:hypothetical protein
MVYCGGSLTVHWSRRGGPPPYRNESDALAAPRLSSSVRPISKVTTWPIRGSLKTLLEGDLMRLRAMRGLAPALAICLVTTLACRDSLRPSGLSGIYVLHRIGQETLPVTDTTGWTVVVDTLTLRADGSGRHIRLTAPAGQQPSSPDAIRWDVPLSYRPRFPGYEVFFGCPPNANCVPGPHAFFFPKSDSLSVHVIGSDARWYYQRVGAPD